MRGVVVRVVLVQSPTDVTGEACVGCGDTPWLEAVGMTARANGRLLDNHKLYLCPDCAEQIRDQFGDAVEQEP